MWVLNQMFENQADGYSRFENSVRRTTLSGRSSVAVRDAPEKW